MKKIINKNDIKKANNIERCRMIILIIKGQAIFKSEVKQK